MNCPFLKSYLADCVVASIVQYGNDAHPDMMYSTCGIVAMVPPYITRKSMLGKD